MDVQQRNLLPQADGLDAWHASIKALFSSLPGVGGAASAFFDLVIAPPVSIRRDTWFQDLADDIRVLKDQVAGFDPEKLPENQVFISTVMQTTQMALRTHQQEKLDALRNITLHSATQINIDETVQAIFLNLIDRFAPLHLQLLRLLNDPSGWANERGITYPEWYFGGSISALFECALPELKGHRAHYDLVGKDLFVAGLIDTEQFNTTMTSSGLLTSRTTMFGKQFLQHIVNPVTGTIP